MAAIDTTKTLSNARRNEVSDIYVANPFLDAAGRKAAFENSFGENLNGPAGEALLRKYRHHWYECDTRWTVRGDVVAARRQRWAQAIRPGDEKWVLLDAIYPNQGVFKDVAKKVGARYEQLWDAGNHTDEEAVAQALSELVHQNDPAERARLRRLIMANLRRYFL